jgi:hypothetical protein
MMRLSLRHNPLGLLFSSSLWASVCYLLSYLFTGTVLFTIVICALVIAVCFGITLIGLVLLVAVAVVVRGCAYVERGRLRIVYTEPVRGLYRDTTGQKWTARLKTQWTDPALWRDIAYLVGLYGPLFALDLAVLCVWLTFLAGITVPLWYAKVTHACLGFCLSNKVTGIHLDNISIHTQSSALVLAAICLVGFLLFSYLVVVVAKLHAYIARALLRAPEDPPRKARDVLSGPGPLTSSPRI